MKRIIKQFLIITILVLSISFSTSLLSQKSYSIYDLQEAFPEDAFQSFGWAAFPVENNNAFFVFGHYSQPNSWMVPTTKTFCLKISETG
ncbi:hypothetical protein N9934_00900 [Desulfosarcina sp.]|nr:hypothetical protein [Desulfosarcina sp.]